VCVSKISHHTNKYSIKEKSMNIYKVTVTHSFLCHKYFVSNKEPDEFKEVLDIDEDKSPNPIELENGWCDPSDDETTVESVEMEYDFNEKTRIEGELEKMGINLGDVEVI
jgi:hypothetical protein